MLWGMGVRWMADLVPELRNKRRITVAAASKILANLTFAYKNMGLGMGTMLAGVCISPPRKQFNG